MSYLEFSPSTPTGSLGSTGRKLLFELPLCEDMQFRQAAKTLRRRVLDNLELDLSFSDKCDLAFKRLHDEIQSPMQLLNPVDGHMVTHQQGAQAPFVSWSNREAEGYRMLAAIMRNLIVSINATTEAFCADILEHFIDKVFPRDFRRRHSSGDYKRFMYRAVQLAPSNRDHASLERFFAEVLLDRNHFHKLRQDCISDMKAATSQTRPTLNHILEVAEKKLCYKIHHKGKTSPKDLATFFVTECPVILEVRDYYISSEVAGTEGGNFFNPHEVCFANVDAMDRCSRVIYGLRCIIAHGRAERTIKRTLPAVDFEARDFRVAPFGTEGDVKVAVEKFNNLLGKARGAMRRDGSVDVDHEDYANVLNFCIPLYIVLEGVISAMLNQDAFYRQMEHLTADHEDDEDGPNLFDEDDE